MDPAGDKELLSTALEEAEAAKVDVPLMRRATTALREIRRKAARVTKKGKSSGRGDPAHRRSASPHQRRRSSRSASPGAAERVSDSALRPGDLDSSGQFWQGSSESSGDFSIPAGKAGAATTGVPLVKDAEGGSPNAGQPREADRGSPPLSSQPSMSLSQHSSFSDHSNVVAPPPAQPRPQLERQPSERHGQHGGTAAGKAPHLVRDSVGELAAAVAMKVEALEKERERQREEKRQTRSREAAERAAAAAQEKAADEAVNAADKAAKADKAADAHTPKASFRGNSFFGRKATPVGTASPAGSGAGGDREWRYTSADIA